ncbi:MAG: cytidine deaminase [Bacteroidota bacterium]
MAQHQLDIPYEILEEAAMLPSDEQDLLEKALEATQFSYSPHSNFQVGCALLLENGEVIIGANQENAAFPSGLCAERTALYAASTAGKATQVIKMAIRARSDEFSVNQPPTSCGGCRQVMVEFEKRSPHKVVVLMQGETGHVLRLHGIQATLMPFSFDLLE